MKKALQSKLCEFALVGVVIGAMALSVGSMFSDANEQHIERSGGGDSKLLPMNHHPIIVKTFGSINECEMVNKRISPSRHSVRSYSEFNQGCAFIFNQAAIMLSAGEQLKGVSVLSSFGFERYYPVIANENDELTYPGGFGATFDYRELKPEEATKINETLITYGVK